MIYLAKDNGATTQNGECKKFIGESAVE